MRAAIIDGQRVVSTTELCERLGTTVSSAFVKSLNIVSPLAETSTGVYWRDEHVPIIAMALAKHFANRAIDLQLVVNDYRVAVWR